MDACREHLCVFNPDWIKEAHGEIDIVERDPDGAGIARFHSASPCVLIRADKHAPLIWSLSQRKCADGAILSFDDVGAHLHIVELKSTVTLGTWAHAMQQLEGMYLAALAVSRLLQIDKLLSVTCYLAGAADKVTGASRLSASPSLFKTAVGKSTTFGGLESWTSEIVPLPFGVSATLKKQWKDGAGLANFGEL